MIPIFMVGSTETEYSLASAVSFEFKSEHDLDLFLKGFFQEYMSDEEGKYEGVIKNTDLYVTNKKGKVKKWSASSWVEVFWGFKRDQHILRISLSNKEGDASGNALALYHYAMQQKKKYEESNR